MKRIIFFLVMGVIINQPLFAQPYSFEWVDGFGGPYVDAAYGMFADEHGNTYTTGIFSDTVDFDPGSGTFYLYPSGGFDAFILKLDSAKNFVWAKQIVGVAHSYGNNVTVDEQNNVYAIGRFQGTTDLDPGPAVYNVTAGNGMYVLKLNPFGNLVWAKAIVGSGIDASHIYVDSDGNVFTCGKITGTVDFDPGPAVYNLTDTHSAFISKLDSSGNFVWAKNVGDDAALAYELVEDSDDNIYVTGYYRASGDFDPGPGSYILGGIDLYPIIFSLKLDEAGNFMRAFKVGTGADQNYGRSLKIDHSGSMLLGGPFEEPADFDPGPGVFTMTPVSVRDGFICKYDTAFNFIWSKQLTGGYLTIYRILTDSLDNIFICGEFMDTVDFDPGPGVFNLISAGEEDAYIARYDASGDFVWAGRMGGNNHWDRAFAMGIDAIGNIYACGTFSDTADFDPDTSSVYELHSLGNPTLTTDNYVLKLAHCLSTGSSIFETACDSFSLNGYTYYSSGIYNLSLTNVDGCDSSVTLNLTINTVDNSVVQSGATITSNASTATYQWVNCDLSYAVIPGAIGSSFTPLNNGNYAVVIDQFGCLDTSVCVLVLLEGLSGMNSNNLKIFPNPADDILYINLSDGQTYFTVNIYDLSGRLVSNYRKTGANIFEIPVNDIASGTYILELIANHEILIERFIKK